MRKRGRVLFLTHIHLPVTYIQTTRGLLTSTQFPMPLLGTFSLLFLVDKLDHDY
jgi:hypothetical protein